MKIHSNIVSEHPFLDAIQAPAQWGASQFTSLPEKLTEDITTIALQVLVLIPATLALMIGAIPYGFSMLGKGLLGKEIKFFIICNVDEYGSRIAEICKERFRSLNPEAINAWEDPEAFQAAQNPEDSDHPETYEDLELPEVYVVKVRKEQIRVFDGDQVLANWHKWVADGFNEERKQYFIYISSEDDHERRANEAINELRKGAHITFIKIERDVTDEEAFIRCAKEINRLLK